MGAQRAHAFSEAAELGMPQCRLHPRTSESWVNCPIDFAVCLPSDGARAWLYWLIDSSIARCHAPVAESEVFGDRPAVYHELRSSVHPGSASCPCCSRMKCAILTIDPFKYLYFLILHAADLHQSHEDASCSEHARQRVAKMDRLLLPRTPGCSLYGSIQVAPVSWIDGHPCGCWPSRTSGAADVSWRPLFDSVAGSFSVPIELPNELHRLRLRAPSECFR